MASSIQTKMICCCTFACLVSVALAAPGLVSTPAPGCDAKSAPSAPTAAPAPGCDAKSAPSAPTAAPAAAPAEPAPAAPAAAPAETPAHPAAEAPDSAPVYESMAGGSATGSHPNVITYTENEPKSSSAVGYASAAEGSVVAYSKSG